MESHKIMEFRVALNIFWFKYQSEAWILWMSSPVHTLALCWHFSQKVLYKEISSS